MIQNNNVGLLFEVEYHLSKCDEYTEQKRAETNKLSSQQQQVSVSESAGILQELFLWIDLHIAPFTKI